MEWDMAVLLKAAGSHPALKVTDKWMKREYARKPWELWRPVHPYAVVEVRNCFNEPTIGVAHQFDWRFETDIGLIGETVIVRCRQLFKNGKPLYRVPARIGNARVSKKSVGEAGNTVRSVAA